MATFIAREINPGCCTQFSYEGEQQETINVESADELKAALEKAFGAPVISKQAITRGDWQGATALTFANKRWVRVRKVKA